MSDPSALARCLIDEHDYMTLGTADELGRPGPVTCAYPWTSAMNSGRATGLIERGTPQATRRHRT
jgi:hypothetical protein